MMKVCNSSYNISSDLIGTKPNTTEKSTSLCKSAISQTDKNTNQNLIAGRQVSFTGISEKIGTGIAKVFSPEFVNSKGLFSAAKIAANGVLLQSCIVLFINTIPRPAAIMAIPGAKIEDKKYAAVKSIASGITDFFITGGLFYFIKKGLDKWAKHPNCIINKWTQSEPAKEGMKKTGTELINWGLKYAIGIPQAFLMFSLIPPIVKIIFPKKNNSAIKSDTKDAERLAQQKKAGN